MMAILRFVLGLKFFNGLVLRKFLFMKEVSKLAIIFTGDVSLERYYQLNIQETSLFSNYQ